MSNYYGQGLTKYREDTNFKMTTSSPTRQHYKEKKIEPQLTNFYQFFETFITTYYSPSMFLNPEDIAVNKVDNIPVTWTLTVSK